MSHVIIEAHGLKRYYHRGSETVKALDGVDVTIHEGEIVSVLGPSGSGKTTLINLLSCLDAPTEGTLLVAGKSVGGLAEDELVEVTPKSLRLRKKILQANRRPKRNNGSGN